MTTLESYTPQRITGLIRRNSHLPLADCEDLADIIWMECFVKHTVPSRKMILHTIIDFVRHRNVELTGRQHYIDKQPAGPDKKEVEYTRELLAKSHLTYQETQVLHGFFWRDLTLHEIALELKLPSSTISTLKSTALDKLYATARREQ